VTVPVDWSAPSGATLQLAVIRHRATGKKIGSLFTNPGGPGVSGVQDLRDRVVPQFGKSLQSSFDLVSWDPRGTGGSSPVKCLPNSALDHFWSEDATPDTPQEVTQYVDDTKAFAQACEANTGPVLEHIDTISTAKDMDVLRAMVGDDVFSYIGASNGTYLGAWYAQEFPWRVGRMVLDGVVDPSLDGPQFAQGQAIGFARALRSYVDDCLRTQGCPLKGTRDDAYGQLGRLADQIDAQPLRTDSGRPLTQALFNTGILLGMYSQQLWPAVTKALTQAFKGNGTTMLLLADSYLERDSKGVYGETLTAFFAISCLDHPDPRSVDEIAADSARLKAAYPPFGDVLGWGQVPCQVWPFSAGVPAQKITAAGSKPILVVGTTDDPATPYEWAQSLASQLSNGRLLTRKGQGHTAYQNGSACTDKAIETYLVSGTLPAAGTVCT
jgi:pimeloyl-ACP methyl ester carboxylesterase